MENMRSAATEDVDLQITLQVLDEQTRALISQDYWRDIKEDWGSGGRKCTSGVQGQSPGRGSGGQSPQKLKLFL